LKFRKFQDNIALNDLCTSIQNAAQFRAAFLRKGQFRKVGKAERAHHSG
jgi:hypothetical protein